MGPDSKKQDLYERMRQARADWEAASDVLRKAMELFRDLNASPDGVTSVRLACKLEIEALRAYREAVEAYAKTVRSGRNPST